MKKVATISPPVVGIGASAGGLEAFVLLLGHLPADTGFAYVIVQHLDPNGANLLTDILTRVASIPVIDASDGVLLEADHVYVIPPGTSMTVTDGHLCVAKGIRSRGVQTLIDDFLRSLAETHGSDAIAVVLSGSGSDGSAGVEAIKERGGIIIAQEPASAHTPAMPASAIATGCVDFVLPPEQIGPHFALLRAAAIDVSDRSTVERGVQQILTMVHDRTGADFTGYRPGTVHRRILRQMAAHRRTTHAEYLEHLRAKPETLDLLHADILIGVTHFFRDPAAFAALATSAFPEMMRSREPDVPVRAWVAGCSTGEEAYSIAISLLEFFESIGQPDRLIHVFGTDLNDAAVVRARTGLYSAAIEREVSSDRLERYFTKEKAGYRVSRRVRQSCVFATHNIIRDPPFSQLDLVCCRNVLIYFGTELKDRVFPLFHYALRPSGLLMLGAAESVGARSQYFATFDKPSRIFTRQATVSRRAELGARAVANILPPLRLERSTDEPDGLRAEDDGGE